MKRVRFSCLLALWIVACASDVAEPIDELEASVGGPAGMMELFDTASESELRARLAEHGISYVVSALSQTPSSTIDDCPQYFPAADTNAWHSLNGEYYYIDAVGRPSRAYIDLPPIVAEARSETCQGNVGRWGDAENPSNDYDGGHLIGSQLGGWGRRANLVPQDANFNRGNWVALENAVADCSALLPGSLRYYIGAYYPNATTLIPDTMTMEIVNQMTGASVSLSFLNTDYGGPNGTYEKNRGVAFIAAQGCGAS